MSVEIVQGFLPLDLLEKVRQVPRKTDRHRSNITSWDQGLIQASAPVLLFDLPDDLREEVKRVVDVRYPAMAVEELTGAVFTAGGKLSYLPYHYDSSYKMAITVYLNDLWMKDYAGALIYLNDETLEHHAVYPEFNKAVVIVPPVSHCTIMPNLHAPMRESLQIFIGHDVSNTTEKGY